MRRSMSLPVARKLRRTLLFGLSLQALLGSAALAEPAPPFKELLRQAQATAPRLAEARAEIARAEGLARQAGAFPNPTVGVQVENFAASNGLHMAETTASIEQTIELGGKRPARIAAGRADVEAARRRVARVQSEYAFDLAAAYAEAEGSDRRLQLAADGLELAQEDARIAGVLVEAGREADLRRVQAQAAVQAARAAVDQAKAARATAFANLTAMVGAPAPITSIPVSLLDEAAKAVRTPDPNPLASPSYLAAEAEREAAARRVRVERTQATPDVTVSFGVRKTQENNATAMLAGVAMPFPIFNRNGGNISAARAELSAAEARLHAARLDAEAAARSGIARVSAAETRLVAARGGEQTAEEAYRLTRIGYEGGKLALVELLSARRALTEARTQTIEAATERLSAQAALARLAGVTPFGDQP
ncbi:cobalt-zinc-cadmium efflux system outer membrane protein [Phenylobacterium haematophilum]|uniref:Cobalt-zinc-cadmium efflux system outer membrane protein n=1 Tax=Phenylobacterium haematophilum TaxID=98513 RepID=A0A840A4I7_9CAUL|nr:cobalt-zinc-cadmium efflux system outer membrane protein [Phenylobacterium haematophilum]